MNLEQIAEEIVKRGESKGFDEIEVYLVKEKNSLIQIIESLVTAKMGEEIGVGIRASIGKKVGFIATSIVDLDKIDVVLDNLKSIVLTRPEDKDFDGFADPKSAKHRGGVIDTKIYEAPIDEISESVKSVFESVKKLDYIVKLEYHITLADEEIIIANSRGLLAKDKITYAMAFAEVKGKNETLAMDYHTSRKLEIDKLVGVLENAARKVKDFLDAKKLSEPFEGAAVIVNKEVSNFLQNFVSYNFSALNIQENRSKFVGKLNEKVAAEKLTILDNPENPNALLSLKYDGEGVPTYKKALIENGVLRTYLYDVYSARREGKESTGNGVRTNYRSQPSPSPLNVELVPTCNKDAQALINELDKGIFVAGYVMGSHMADLINGVFSLTSLESYYIKNGEIKYPIRSVTITGNFFDVINSILKIGNDLEVTIGGIYPSILVKGLRFI